MPHLSETFELYQRVKIYPYSVNDLDLKIFSSNLDSTGIFQFADRTLCLKIVFCVQCYNVLSFPIAYYSGYGVILYSILNRNDFCN